MVEAESQYLYLLTAIRNYVHRVHLDYTSYAKPSVDYYLMLMRSCFAAIVACAAAEESLAQTSSTRPESSTRQGDSDGQDALEAEVRELRQAASNLQQQLRQLAHDSQKNRNVASATSDPAQADAPLADSAPSTPPGRGRAVQSASHGPGPDRSTIGDELTGLARPDTAAPPKDPELRGFITIPGTETRVKSGGFAKVTSIYDTAPAGNSDRFIRALIPVDSRAGTNSSISATATRMSSDARPPCGLGRRAGKAPMSCGCRSASNTISFDDGDPAR